SRRKRDGITAVSPPLEAKNEGFLFVPVDESVAATLDLETVMVAEISDPLQPLLNETFSYWPQEGVVVGRIPRAGRYQVFALPKDPWIRTTFDTLARHWKWVERDPSLREVTGRRGRTAQPEIINRICQVILFAPEYDRLEDPRSLDGIGKPPRASAALGGFEDSDVGERISSLLGDLDV